MDIEEPQSDKGVEQVNVQMLGNKHEMGYGPPDEEGRERSGIAEQCVADSLAMRVGVFR